jgi:hypothetical protein
MAVKKVELTEKEYGVVAFQTALAKSILANQFALHSNEVLKGTDYFKSDIKKHGKPFFMALMRAEAKEFEKVDQVDTEFVDRNFDNLEKVLQKLSIAIFCDWEELDLILTAHAKDRDSIYGIAKKVMRKKN